jgi:inner membrane protein
MPTILGHALFGLSLTPLRPFRGEILKTMLLAMMCAMIPDIDVIGFSFGIKYGSMWGHRGFTHSILFAILFAWLIAWVFYRDYKKDKAIFIFIIYMCFKYPFQRSTFCSFFMKKKNQKF